MPVRDTVPGELSASLVSVNWALAMPEALGINLTFTCVLLPTAIFSGSESPGRVNSELFDWTAETVTGATLAERLMVRERAEPTLTLPKSRLEGLMVRCGF